MSNKGENMQKTIREIMKEKGLTQKYMINILKTSQYRFSKMLKENEKGIVTPYQRRVFLFLKDENNFKFQWKNIRIFY